MAFFKLLKNEELFGGEFLLPHFPQNVIKFSRLKINWRIHFSLISLTITNRREISILKALCYSNTELLTLVRILNVLWSTTDKINSISNHFWHRWKHEYVENVCQAQRASKLNINSQKIVLLMMKKFPGTFGELSWWREYHLVDILKHKGTIVRIKKANAILKTLPKWMF